MLHEISNLHPELVVVFISVLYTREYITPVSLSALELMLKVVHKVCYKIVAISIKYFPDLCHKLSFIKCEDPCCSVSVCAAESCISGAV